MTRIIFIKSFNYQTFKKNENQFLFSYIQIKIRLALPAFSHHNQKIILNDGLPLEFIINGFSSNCIVNNRDIIIHDLSVKTFNHDELFRHLNQFMQTFKTDNIIVIGVSGNEDSLSDIEIEVPVLFIGDYFKNKVISNDITYTINDLYHNKVANARGQVIQFYDKIPTVNKVIVTKQETSIKHIVLFASDAFGSYLLQDNKLPNLNKIIANGAITLQVHSVIPTVSAVNWNSIMCGLSPNLHGFLEWNSFPAELTPVLKTKDNVPPSLFSLVKTSNPTAKTCAFFRWP
ncbi:alkaline phosphatase family protein [Spiroplasma endosymbiont of Virgichneumon dumeticola]|uniref:alkaline phosphatase family protein n=1 Tax=Spiroplasma endosymbiont of Virgichneumon dumeticola TaxID=3139323 RepID=UPI0035C9312A